MKKLNRRQWNNILILVVVICIGILNAPRLIHTYFGQQEVSAESSPQVAALLDTQQKIVAIHTEHWSLEKQQGQWQITGNVEGRADTLVQHWQELQGTVVDDATYQALSAHLSSPEYVEVWYQNSQSPQTVTLYRTAQFMLFLNEQQQWIAISVQPSYLQL